MLPQSKIIKVQYMKLAQKRLDTCVSSETSSSREAGRSCESGEASVSSESREASGSSEACSQNGQSLQHTIHAHCTAE